MIGFVINGAFTALNFGLYANSGSPFSLAAGIFCAFMALFCLVLDLS